MMGTVVMVVEDEEKVRIFIVRGYNLKSLFY